MLKYTYSWHSIIKKVGGFLITYAEKHIIQEDVSLFREIERVIDAMDLPDIGLNSNGETREISCHMIAEAVSRIYNIKLIHGYFMTCYEHSWLYTKNNNIIDVYPIAMVGGPILIDGIIISRNSPFYRVKNDLIDSESSKQDYKNAVNLIEKSIVETIQRIQLNDSAFT